MIDRNSHFVHLLLDDNDLILLFALLFSDTTDTLDDCGLTLIPFILPLLSFLKLYICDCVLFTDSEVTLPDS